MTDDELLKQIFQQASLPTDIADNGFTDRVMQQIATVEKQTAASDCRRLSRLWTTFCIALGIVLFVMLRGWEPIAYRLVMLMNNPPSQTQVLSVLLSVAVVGLMAVSELLQRQKYIF